jgi:thioredoxin 1
MATIELTKDTFEQTIVDNDMVLVDFWADWCGPCKMFAPVYEKVSEQYPDAVFAKVDTEANPELAQYFGIRSIPTLMIFREQIGIFSQPGALPEPSLTDLVDQAKKIDMDQVRAEIEATQTEADQTETGNAAADDGVTETVDADTADANR